MGDICDTNELERFMRSREGQKRLESIRSMLRERTITDVSFSNEGQFIATALHLDDGDTFFFPQPSLELDVLRVEFEDVLEREYYQDYPERKPQGSGK